MRKCNKVLLGCIILFLGLNAVSVKGDVKGHRTTWDCIWFGTYPQTEIPNVSQLTNKKYLYNAKERQYGYTAKNKEGEKVTVGMIDYTTEKHILLKNSFKSTGGDRNFKFKPIKWRILKTNGNKALLLSDKIIDQYYMYKPSFVDALIFYTGLQTDFIWRNSSLRNYMNSDMYEMAFSVYEQDAILDSRVTSGFTYKDEKDVTTDKLFILSHDELVKNYGFSSQESLMCRISDFARASGVDIYDSYGKYGTYYALSDGYKSTHFRYGDEYEYACCEAYNDVIDNTGLLKRKNALYYNGIRVAMWVDLSKCEYQNAGTVSSNGDVNEIKFKYPIKLSRVKIKSVKNVRKKSISISFGKVKSAKKYKIQYATNKKFKKAKVKTSKKTRYKIKKLKLRRTYYIRVRAINGKKQGKWSKVKHVRLRK